MRILFITHFDGYYGSSRSLMSLLQGLISYDITPFVAIPHESGFTKELADHNISFTTINMPLWVSTKSISLRQKAKMIVLLTISIIKLIKMVYKLDIDLIYSNSSVIPSGRLTSLISRVPHIWHIREFGDLDFSFQFIFSKFLSQKLIESSDAIICHARAVRNHRFSPELKNIYQIYNGCATKSEFDNRFSIRQAQQSQGEFIFAMASEITPKKGQETAIKALAKLRGMGFRCKLLIAGSGKKSYINYLNELVKFLDIEEIVEFLGFVNDPFDIYNSANCILICSDHEALSRVGLEAMSTASPLIAKKSGGNPEIIVHGETGFLYNSFDELVKAIKEIVQNPELGKQMGLAGWHRAKELFNIEDYAANVYQVIQSVTK